MSDFSGKKVVRQRPWFFERPWGLGEHELQYLGATSSDEEYDWSSDDESPEVDGPAPAKPQVAAKKMLKMEEGNRSPVPSPEPSDCDSDDDDKRAQSPPRPHRRPAPAKKMLEKMKPATSDCPSDGSDSEDEDPRNQTAEKKVDEPLNSSTSSATLAPRKSDSPERRPPSRTAPQCQMPKMESKRTTVKTEKENNAPVHTLPMERPPPQRTMKVSLASIPAPKPQTMPRKKSTQSDGSGQDSKKKPSRPGAPKRAPAARRQPKQTVNPNGYDPRAMAVAIPKMANRREEVTLKRHRFAQIHGPADAKRRRL